ncbi:MAG TPA: hypothetical protein VHP37_24760 [Burkholderiales bacterium]|nr:hypothetical protein [Burkholderiales bacterium]
MALNTTTRGQIVNALAILTRRRTSTTDPAEEAAIGEAIDLLNGHLQDLNQAQLRQTTQIAAAAAGELEKVVAAARTGAFEPFVAEIQDVIAGLRTARA